MDSMRHELALTNILFKMRILLSKIRQNEDDDTKTHFLACTSCTHAEKGVIKNAYYYYSYVIRQITND